MTVHVTAPTLFERPDHEAVFRIWLLSDLRVHEADFVPPEGVPAHDAVVVAGGVRPGLAEAVRWLDAAFGDRSGDRRLILVPGALEFEDRTPVPEALALGAEAAREVGVDLLHDGSARIGAENRPGLHVIGATLWPALMHDGPRKAGEARGHARHRWKACRTTLAAPDLPFLPHDAVGAHARSRAYVEDALRGVWVNGEGFGGKPAVVTGIRGGDRSLVATAFPPLRACLPPEMARPLFDPWAPNWLGSDVAELFDGVGAPAAWVHGSVPYSLDMRVGRTRVVANPRGRREPTAGFEPGRIITV